MKHLVAASILCATLAGVTVTNAQFVISSGTGLFDPSFRGAANTTWFGWGYGGFEGSVNNELIDNPAATIGAAPVGVSFTQSPANDILSSSENIYTGAAGATDLLLGIPTSGTSLSGFTTIIVQGKTAFGGYDIAPLFAEISGVTPSFAVGLNSLGQGQFWAKYEIPGNESGYNLTVSLAAMSFISIAELEVDTYWSATSFAPDSALVPEPSVVALCGLGMLALFGARRRS